MRGVLILVVLVGAVIALAIWAFASYIVATDGAAPVTVNPDDRILVEQFFSYHRAFIMNEGAVRAAVDNRDWVALRTSGEDLSEGANTTAVICAALTPSVQLLPMHRAFLSELDRIDQAGRRIAAIGGSVPFGADPNGEAVARVLAEIAAVAEGYDRVYDLFQVVGDGGWTPAPARVSEPSENSG